MGLKIDIEEAQAEIEEAKRRRTEPSGDRRICVCGHPMVRHKALRGELRCRPAAVKCACRVSETALVAGDIRTWIFKSEGSGGKHALAKGIARAVERGQTLEFELGEICMLCQREADTAPVGVGGSMDQFWLMRTNPEVTLLVCAGCREGVENGRVTGR